MKLSEATRKYSDIQETKIANMLSAKKQSNSGATPFNKGDVKSDVFLIEAKTAMKKVDSFRIKKEWIDTIREEAFGEDREHWAIAFNFGDNLDNGDEFFIISEQDFKLLNEILSREEM